MDIQDGIYENPNGCTAVIWDCPSEWKAWKVNVSNSRTGEHLKVYYFDTYEEAVTAAEKVFPWTYPERWPEIEDQKRGVSI